MNIKILQEPRSEKDFYPIHKFLESVWTGEKKIYALCKNAETFEFFKKSLWVASADRMFPYVDVNNEFSDLSPFVCGSTLRQANGKSILISVDTVLSREEISSFGYEEVAFMFISPEKKAEQMSVLQSADIQFSNASRDSRGDSRAFSQESKPAYKKPFGSNGSGDAVQAGQGFSTKNQQYPNKKSGDRYQGKEGGYKRLDRAIVIIKPVVLIRKQEFLLTNYLLGKDISVVYFSRKRLPIDTWKDFYSTFKNEHFFETMCEYLATSPVGVCIVEGDNVIERGRALIGDKDPANCTEDNIRALFGESIFDNGIHMSDSQSEYEREKNVLFGSTTRKG